MDPAFVSSNLNLAAIEEFLETLGLLIPPAVLVALAGVLVDAFRGSRPIPPFWGLVARVVLVLLLLALAPTLYLLAWSLTETVRSRSLAEVAFLSAGGFVTLALGMGLFAWSFLLRASRRPSSREIGAAEPADR